MHIKCWFYISINVLLIFSRCFIFTIYSCFTGDLSKPTAEEIDDDDDDVPGNALLIQNDKLDF